MICENCGKEIPDRAKSCQYCEATVDDELDMAPGEIMGALEAAGLNEEMLGEMKELAKKAGTAEEFADMIFIGSCPKCGSDNVANCEETRGIEDETVARCFQCGLIWCAECGHELKAGEAECPHWNICAKCEQEEDCPHIMETSECPQIAQWVKSTTASRKGPGKKNE